MLQRSTLTLRFEVRDPERLREQTAAEPFILAFWHHRLLLVPVIWNHFFAQRRRARGMALTSTSRDGELIAQFLNRFGIGPVRGSTTRRDAAALRELAHLLQRGHNVAITPDGSRGRLCQTKGGMVVLAQMTGRPVLPISWEFSRAWRLKSWDRFIIPKPFARVTLHVGEPYFIPRDAATPEAFESERRRCEQAMLRLVQDR